ncbi:phosphoglycerate mutase [Boeremia exigua]|uniref:phosphoglycerate mutase n=1 Tax=Boeremia exigua TaxID=749465 RepID=UPI001E8E5952|nr:phosphoglycerate mutase [Boeremia exigua]KAH6625521.1 phosphoglycerate mutase [Boeremia exigua]
MARIIHCVRHAQGVHNLSYANHDIPDPSLTPLGECQCHDLAKMFLYHDNVELVVASPLRRTLHTGLLAFAPEVARGVQVLALPLLQEASSLPCDTGSDVATIEKEFKDTVVDFSEVLEGWQVKENSSLTTAALLDRAEKARQWLLARQENNIVVVSHGCFLHFLTDDWYDSVNTQATGWGNTEFRSYELSGGPESTSLRETAESRSRRGLKEFEQNFEQQNLAEKKITLETWRKWGIVTG